MDHALPGGRAPRDPADLWWTVSVVGAALAATAVLCCYGLGALPGQ